MTVTANLAVIIVMGTWVCVVRGELFAFSELPLSASSLCSCCLPLCIHSSPLLLCGHSINTIHPAAALNPNHQKYISDTNLYLTLFFLRIKYLTSFVIVKAFVLRRRVFLDSVDPGGLWKPTHTHTHTSCLKVQGNTYRKLKAKLQASKKDLKALWSRWNYQQCLSLMIAKWLPYLKFRDKIEFYVAFPKVCSQTSGSSHMWEELSQRYRLITTWKRQMVSKVQDYLL